MADLDLAALRKAAEDAFGSRDRLKLAAWYREWGDQPGVALSLLDRIEELEAEAFKWHRMAAACEGFDEPSPPGSPRGLPGPFRTAEHRGIDPLRNFVSAARALLVGILAALVFGLIILGAAKLYRIVVQ